MSTDERTIAQLAEEVLAVQDACNLSGVVLAWGRSIVRLHRLFPDYGTDAINMHPINQLWADKVAHLTETQDSNSPTLSAAYDCVAELAHQ